MSCAVAFFLILASVNVKYAAAQTIEQVLALSATSNPTLGLAGLNDSCNDACAMDMLNKIWTWIDDFSKSTPNDLGITAGGL